MIPAYRATNYRPGEKPMNASQFQALVDITAMVLRCEGRSATPSRKEIVDTLDHTIGCFRNDFGQIAPTEYASAIALLCARLIPDATRT